MPVCKCKPVSFQLSDYELFYELVYKIMSASASACLSFLGYKIETSWEISLYTYPTANPMFVKRS